MAKKLIQGVMQRLNTMIPDKENIAKNKSLKFLGDKLHQPHLWHINRHSVARAFAVGGFAMYTPPLPWQMVIAAVLAIYFEANLPISVALVWITNPLTWIPLYYVAYSLGALLLGGKSYSFDDFQSVFASLGDAWDKLGAPFLVGCFAMMILCAIAGYFGIQTFWRYHVMKAWEKRKQRRREGVQRVFEGAAEAASATPKSPWLAMLETAWTTHGKPLLQEGITIAGIGLDAGRDGVEVFWSQATAAWKRHQLEKQEAQRQTAATLSETTQAAPQEQPAALMALLETAWLNQGKPLLLEGLKMLQIVANAGDAGMRTFWRNAVKAMEQRKGERQEAQPDNHEPLITESETDGPQL